ncbi:hypothetical protein BAE44_0010967 [Dichanthelium oligosanthes]|uniref:Uncharacterized protein n=1 Tax=Dichanthelium oligosanthes TaxID=888268 RepID=A0A1E5VSA8_9POAL|nr:hypothetical protein BAE44_0010967 [Dichanthelium oligosanthes]
MAGRCSFLPLARLLLLVVLLSAVLHGDVSVARPLRGIAEPPASPGAVAEGPGAAAAQPGGGGSSDRSETGGEVILAGFAAAVIIVIACYIRVTRESSSSSAGAEGKQERLGGF